MAFDRPTFHEAWYRVANLRPRLLSTVKVSRQQFRGRVWYVLENVTSNTFSRISQEAYRVVALLDGTRQVAEAWKLCNEQLGDEAPTQGEVIQLLGQLYTSNLLYAELAPDAESLFNRQRTRVKRQVQRFLTNILFVRIPLIDPDHFLDRWVGVLGKCFTWPAFLLWAIVVVAGLYHVIANLGELVNQSADVLAPDNILLLYVTFIVIKVAHEFAHAFACKKFGILNQGSGQVHVMGLMLLVFTPVPYLDASSAWAFRSKWHRALVGAAGVIVEVFFAAIATIVWASTSTGTLHIISYNVIFVASVSTLLFNGNPLLRFDAYYVLADLIEIPNLSQRSLMYLGYLVRRYVWHVKNVPNPATTRGERIWFVCYGIASTAYRFYICFAILLFLNDRLPEELFIIVPIMAITTIVMWIFVPLIRFAKYLATSPELTRTRPRAVLTTLGAAAVLVTLLGVIPFHEHHRIEGVVEPVRMAIVHAESDGFVTDVLPSGCEVTPEGQPLLAAANPMLDAEKKGVTAELAGLEVKRRLAELRETATVQIIDEQMQALRERIARVDFKLAALTPRAPFPGTWISPEIDRAKGAYVRRGQQLGIVADVRQLRLRATAGQELAALLVAQGATDLELRARDRPDVECGGVIAQIFPAGHDVLPSQSLGYAAGGSVATNLKDPRGMTTAEKFFEVRITPPAGETWPLLTGQRAIVRLTLPSRPLAAQWWQSLRQLFQRRFHF